MEKYTKIFQISVYLEFFHKWHRRPDSLSAETILFILFTWPKLLFSLNIYFSSLSFLGKYTEALKSYPKPRHSPKLSDSTSEADTFEKHPEQPLKLVGHLALLWNKRNNVSYHQRTISYLRRGDLFCCLNCDPLLASEHDTGSQCHFIISGLIQYLCSQKKRYIISKQHNFFTSHIRRAVMLCSYHYFTYQPL